MIVPIIMVMMVIPISFGIACVFVHRHMCMPM
jgi:hypothetical protein